MTTTTPVREWTHDGRPELNRMSIAPVDGPWMNEPDKRHWIDRATDLDCLMLRNGMGAWCGYVAVTEGHPFFGVGYGECTVPDCTDDYCYEHTPEGRLSVHGGITYSDFCRESDDGEGHGICHVPLNGRPERVWWLGFDCNHAGDLSPYDAAYAAKDPRFRLIVGDTYRDVTYVAAECASLAAQLIALESSR